MDSQVALIAATTTANSNCLNWAQVTTELTVVTAVEMVSCI